MAGPVATLAATDERSRSVLALGAAGAAGALVAGQQRLNGELTTALGDALLAATTSFAAGLLTVGLVVGLRPVARQALPRLRRVPWWQCLGGLGGAALVAVGAAAVPVIGVALLTVALVAGQTGGALVVDRVGLGPGPSRPFTAYRLLGAAICLVAVGVSVLGDGARAASPLLLVLVLAAGAAGAVQQALNGQVRRTTGDPVVAALLSFAVGLAALSLGLAVHALAGGLAVGDWPGAERWWLYLGGPIGAAFVTVAAVVVRRLGVLRFGLAVVAGQLAGAVVLDLVVPVGDSGVGLATLAGVLLTLLAVSLSGRTSRS